MSISYNTMKGRKEMSILYNIMSKGKNCHVILIWILIMLQIHTHVTKLK